MNKKVLVVFALIFLFLYIINYLSPMAFGDDYLYAFVSKILTQLFCAADKDACRKLVGFQTAAADDRHAGKVCFGRSARGLVKNVYVAFPITLKVSLIAARGRNKALAAGEFQKALI